jgi:hypothetical protein
MTKLRISLLAVSLLAATGPALAADLPTKAPVLAAPAAAPAPTTTIGIEGSPEWFADPNNAKYQQINDYYLKGTVSTTVAPGWSVGGALQWSDKTSNSPATNQYQVEGNVAYKYKLTSNFSVTGTAGLGYTWGNTGYVTATTYSPNSAANDPFLYYYISGAADWKIDAHWTWNVVNVRYRNAFDRTWLTPKVQTGITYNIDANNAIYANIGYAWKDKGDGKGLIADKFNVAVGYKYSF